MLSNQEKRRKLILDKFLENDQKKLKTIVEETKASISTVRRVINKYKKGESTQRKKGSGRKPGPSNRKLLKNVVRQYDKNPHASLRNIAIKKSTSHTTVKRYKTFARLKTYKQQKVPKRTNEQQKIAEKRSRKLYNEYLTNFDCIVMDDETYCRADFNQLPGNIFYAIKNKNKASKEISTRQISKYPKQYMIWQAICTCGLRSEEFFTTEKLNAEIYIKECLKNRLLPLIRKHKGTVLFWPDLATSHYAKATVEWYKKNKVSYVPKEANPQNCPDLRPIEEYWNQIKAVLRKTRKLCENIGEFKKEWKKACKVVNNKSVEKLMGRVKQKVGKFCHRL